MNASGLLGLTLLAALLGCGNGERSGPFPAAPLNPKQVARAADHELSLKNSQPYIDVRLADLPDSPAAARALIETGFVRRHGAGYSFTSRARSWPCSDGLEDCFRIPFGRNSNHFGTLAELYSPGDKFSRLWGVWFTFRILASDRLAKLADRDGFVETISAAEGACPQVWHSSTPLLVSMVLASYDDPEKLIMKSGLNLRGHSAHPDSSNDITCASAMYRAERDETPVGARHDVNL